VILFQAINRSAISRFLDQEAKQDKQSNMEAQDSCKSQGKQKWKVARGGYNTENIDQSRELDNNYCFLVRRI